jgi:hypothetical protein
VEKLTKLIKRIEMLEAAVFSKPNQKETSPKYVNKISKKKKKASIIIPPNLDELSHSEIVEVAKHKFKKHLTPENLSKITVQIPKDDLISMIKGETQIENVVDPIGEIREKIFDYINQNSLLKSNLSCSTYCPTCPYSKVINCFTVNKRRIINETTIHRG